MKKLLLWCSPEHAPPRGPLTVYWAQYISAQNREKGNISLPEMINENASYWKPRYLSWLDGVGKSPCGTSTVVDALLIRPELSYWWMTIPSEYSLDATSIAYATLRLWALAQIADAHHVKELHVYGASAALQEVLVLWCNGTRRQITFIRTQGKSRDESHLQQRLPSLISGLGYLFLQYFRYFTWNRHKRSFETTDGPALSVIDYFVNLDVEAARKATYTSNYWGPLAPILPRSQRTVSWIHIYTRNSVFPNVRSARTAIRELNRGSNSSRHVLLHDYLTLRVAFKATLQFVRIRRIVKQIAAPIPWVDFASGLDVSPLVRSRLRSDFRGMGAARNALWLSLFEESVPLHQAQSACIYLMENQTWELAFLQARMNRGQGPNIGVAHVPVRTWDFRYALGFSTVSPGNRRTLPKPSLVTVTDPQSAATMIANGLDPSVIVKVEALRFLSRTSITAHTSSNGSGVLISQRVLVFGEYDDLVCAKQLRILEELVPLVGNKCVFIFRPHPAKSFLQERLPTGVSLSEAHAPGEALAECDVVLCSNVSSASLDANLRGLPILMFRDGTVMNGSPLDPESSVVYVNDAAEVSAALENIELGGQSRPSGQSYPMYLDTKLPKWRALLDLL